MRLEDNPPTCDWCSPREEPFTRGGRCMTGVVVVTLATMSSTVRKTCGRARLHGRWVQAVRVVRAAATCGGAAE
ncbi:hypothetical protein E2C01_025775 [Portunus trituberculatus]|uniref:Uncharacterized protein n=1 Tax=Portunus trituberculatus TaxID=210409 RepID=A0A5B7EIV5_PORTR|nr:hypothetical protein [Portunus trituberculatus]